MNSSSILKSIYQHPQLNSAACEEIIDAHKTVNFENVIAYAVENGKMTQQEANDCFNLKSYMIQSLLGAPIMEIVTSGIAAAFTVKK